MRWLTLWPMRCTTSGAGQPQTAKPPECLLLRCVPMMTSCAIGSRRLPTRRTRALAIRLTAP